MGILPLVTPLQELVIGRLAELDLSYRRAAERTNGLCSYATLNHIALGRQAADGVTARTAKGLSLALDVPLSLVQQAISDSTDAAKAAVEFRLPKKAEKLTPKQRKAVLAFVNALLEN